jgi:hypothetical protein
VCEEGLTLIVRVICQHHHIVAHPPIQGARYITCTSTLQLNLITIILIFQMSALNVKFNVKFLSPPEILLSDIHICIKIQERICKK